MLIEIKVKIELSIIRLDTLLVRLKQAMDVHSERRSQNIVLQNCHFWNAKRTVLERKTHRFGTQNAPFWNAKRTILERLSFLSHSQ